MTIAESGLANALTDAIVARDVSRAVALLHPEIDFRAMTPNKFWEASGPAEVDAIFRDWLEDPDEELQSIEATQPVALLNTVRTGWVVHISDAPSATREARTSSSSRRTCASATGRSTGCA